MTELPGERLTRDPPFPLAVSRQAANRVLRSLGVRITSLNAERELYRTENLLRIKAQLSAYARVRMLQYLMAEVDTMLAAENAAATADNDDTEFEPNAAQATGSVLEQPLTADVATEVLDAYQAVLFPEKGDESRLRRQTLYEVALEGAGLLLQEDAWVSDTIAAAGRVMADCIATVQNLIANLVDS